MNRISRSIAAVLVAAGSHAAHAQAPAPSPAGCTYATCALRIEPGFWGQKLVRGAAGEAVEGLNGFGGGVDLLLATADSGGSYGRSYVHNQRTAVILAIVAGATFGIIATQTGNFSRAGDVSPVGAVAMIGGAGVGVASIIFGVRAARDLSRGIWWYNAALPR